VFLENPNIIEKYLATNRMETTVFFDEFLSDHTKQKKRRPRPPLLQIRDIATG